MIAYLAVSVFGIGLLAVLGEKEKYDLIYAISFIPLFLLLVLAYNYGNDYDNYMASFQRILETGSEYDMEFGFQWIAKLFLLLGMPAGWYCFMACFVLFMLVSVSLLIRSQLKPTEHWLAYSIFLFNPYLCLMEYSSIRQAMATFIFLIAIIYLVEKPIWYLVVCLIAITIHKSAIILLPLFLLQKIDKSSKKLLAVELGIAVAEFLLVSMADSLIQRIKPYLNGKYLTYLSSGQHSSLVSTMFIFGLLLLFLYAELKRNEEEKEENTSKEMLIGHLAVLGCYVYIFCMHYAAFNRLAMYFETFFVVAIPQSLRKIKDSWIRAGIIVVILGVYLIKFIHFMETATFSDFVTYQSLIPMLIEK